MGGPTIALDVMGGDRAPQATIEGAVRGNQSSGVYATLVGDVDHTTFDKVFSMGCGVSCPNIPLDGDWELDDPVGKSLDHYRKTRDAIEAHVRGLIE